MVFPVGLRLLTQQVGEGLNGGSRRSSSEHGEKDGIEGSREKGRQYAGYGRQKRRFETGEKRWNASLYGVGVGSVEINQTDINTYERSEDAESSRCRL